MKKFIEISAILMLITFMSICSFSACKEYKQKYGDKQDTSLVSKIKSEKTYEILFDFSNIDTIVYLEDDGVYVLHYNDPDVFDYQTLADITNRYSWYGDYVAVDIEEEEEMLSDFFYDYVNWKNAKSFKERDRLNDKYIIVEHDITFEDGTIDIIFYIGLNPDIDD